MALMENEPTATILTTKYTALMTTPLASGKMVSHSYLYGVNRIAQVSETQTGYFLPDALGSVRQMADEEGEITLAQSYTPYGEVLASEGTAQTAYAFSGEIYDTSTNLLFLRARFYSPVTGRFQTRDTWEGEHTSPASYNAWLYVYANPINITDPSGMYPSYCDNLSNEDRSRVIDCRTENIFLRDYNETVKPYYVNFTSTNMPDFVRGVPVGDIQAQLNIPGHFNDNGLCGTISVAYLISNSMRSSSVNTVYDAFKALLEAGKIWKCVTNPDGTCVQSESGQYETTTDQNYTGNYHIAALINLAYSKFFDAEYGRTDDVEAMVANLNRSSVNTGKAYWIVGIKASGSSGQLRKGWDWEGDKYTGKFEGGGTSHWVVITGFSTEWNLRSDSSSGEPSTWKWVRVYNPFGNRVEYYWWGDIRSSWAEDKGTYVIAKKVPPTWQPNMRGCKRCAQPR
jgi:RHS repeat-associated protein